MGATFREASPGRGGGARRRRGFFAIISASERNSLKKERGKEKIMVQCFTKGAKAGIGLAYLTIEKAEEAVNRFNERFKSKREEGKKTVDGLIKKAEEAKNDIRDLLESAKQTAMSRLDIPTRTEIKNLEKRLQELETKDNREKGS
jgi:polyhydroxyalkanoate synthesis regulator phasin